MTRHTLVTVTLLALIVLAGCTMGGDVDQNQTTTTTVQMPDDATTTQSPTTPANETVTFSPRLIADHQAALNATQSFTARTVLTMRSNMSDDAQSNLTVVREYKIDFAQDRYWSQQNTSVGWLQTKYTTPNATYSQSHITYEDQNRTQYRIAEPPYEDGYSRLSPVNLTRAMGLQSNSTAGLSYAVGENFTYQHLGDTTVNGVPVTKYSTVAIANASELNERALQNSQMELTTAEFTVYVGEDEIVRKVEWKMAFANDSVERRYTVTRTVQDVNATTVPRPDWLDDARNATETNG